MSFAYGVASSPVTLKINLMFGIASRSGIDDFLDNVTVLPPGEWDPKTRIEPPKNIPNKVRRGQRDQ